MGLRVLVFLFALAGALAQSPLRYDQKPWNVRGEVLVLDVSSLTYQGNHPMFPMLSKPEQCGSVCSATPGCNAWTYCNATEGCGSGCLAYTASNPQRECSALTTPAPCSLACTLSNSSKVVVMHCAVGCVPDTSGVLYAACAVKTRTDQGPAGMFSRNPSWALPLTGFGPWGPTSACRTTYDSAKSTYVASDKFPRGMCSLKVVTKPATPAWWTKDPSEWQLLESDEAPAP
jgi:hypothetical protein